MIMYKEEIKISKEDLDSMGGNIEEEHLVRNFEEPSKR